ncbi:MAG: class II aldolase/adducin family protein [Myxococcota bacterium]|nr:class II aldolase/adducin family protein [Myxococcota bacterium]
MLIFLREVDSLDRMAAWSDLLSVVVSCTPRKRREMKSDRGVKVSPTHEQARKVCAAQVIDLAQRMLRERLSAGRSGNVSARLGEGMLITPTGIAADALSAEMLVYLDGEGRGEPGALLPSSEWRFHQAIYQRRAEAEVIVHTHSPEATALACMGRALPPVHYMIGLLGGDQVPCAHYALFGTQALSDSIIEAIGERYHGCLMEKHGCLAFAPSAALAYERVELIEELSKLYLKLLSLGGEVPCLSEAEMVEVLVQMRDYGQQEIEL